MGGQHRALMTLMTFMALHASQNLATNTLSLQYTQFWETDDVWSRCHPLECFYSYQTTSVARASDDFWPRDPASHTLHIANVTPRATPVMPECLDLTRSP